jgi:hypothetical protein
MRRPCLFKERDVKRAARAVLAMGLDIARIEIGQDGRIVVVPGEPLKDGVVPEAEPTPLEQWRAKRSGQG